MSQIFHSSSSGSSGEHQQDFVLLLPPVQALARALCVTPALVLLAPSRSPCKGFSTVRFLQIMSATCEERNSKVFAWFPEAFINTCPTKGSL